MFTATFQTRHYGGARGRQWLSAAAVGKATHCGHWALPPAPLCTKQETVDLDRAQRGAEQSSLLSSALNPIIVPHRAGPVPQHLHRQVFNSWS